MEKIKRCKQCGELKPENQFRRYYKGRSRYRMCKHCESINSRYKYLQKKEVLTQAEEDDINKIEELYDLLRQRGLEPPDQQATVVLDLDAELEKQRAELDRVPDILRAVPQELQDWLTCDLDGVDTEELGDQLLKKYRPQVGVSDDMIPEYDDTYRDVLNKILKRLDDYEDSLN